MLRANLSSNFDVPKAWFFGFGLRPVLRRTGLRFFTVLCVLACITKKEPSLLLNREGSLFERSIR
jgi:hypothetical protein